MKTPLQGRLPAVLSVLGLAAALLPLAAQAQSAAPKLLRFNHVLGAKEPYHQGFLDWAKRVEQRTNGTLKIEVFHSAALGKEEDIIEQMRQGAAIGQNTDAARLGNYVPGIAVVNGPYFAETLDDVAKLRNAPTMKRYQEELASKHGLRVVCFNWAQGYRHVFSNKPVKTPEDLKGQRVRTPPAPIWQESVRAIGATPVAMAFGEMYPALQQRAIDGVELVYNNIPAGRFHEVLKYASETRHILLINFQVVGSKFFDGLTGDQQKALTEECDKAGGETSRQILASEAEVREQLKKRGMTVVEGVDLAAFRRAGEKAYEALRLTEARNALAREIGK